MIFLRAGALLAALGVIAGAFGSHLLEEVLTEARLETFEVAVRYQMYHALALVGIGFSRHSMHYRASGYLFIAGILIFSGSLYLLTLTDTSWLGAVTPLGGVCFIAGWGFLLYKTLETGTQSQTTSSSSKDRDMLG